MITKFRLIFDRFEAKIDLEDFQRCLPASFKVAQESDGLYLTIPTKNSEDESCQYLVERELDRYFYLTAVSIRAEMVRKSFSIGVAIKQTVYGALPEGISPQAWNYELPIQLRLWSLATNSDDLYLKTILFYQIIELTYKKSEYPVYHDKTKPPAPISEARFLRHLVAHSGDVGGQELSIYCEYLGIPNLMFDPTEPIHLKILKTKIKLLENEAKNAIDRSL